MATTYTSSRVAAGIQEKEVHAGMNCVQATYTLTAALVINDVIQMVKVPYGARIHDVLIKVPALEDSTGVVWAVGDGGDDDRFLTAQTGGRSSAAGFARMGATTGIGYVYTADDTIDFKCTTAPTGTPTTSGDIIMSVIYSLTQ